MPVRNSTQPTNSQLASAIAQYNPGGIALLDNRGNTVRDTTNPTVVIGSGTGGNYPTSAISSPVAGVPLFPWLRNANRLNTCYSYSHGAIERAESIAPAYNAIESNAVSNPNTKGNVRVHFYSDAPQIGFVVRGQAGLQYRVIVEGVERLYTVAAPTATAPLCVSGSTTTARLAASEGSGTSYTGQYFTIVGGTGAGQASKLITSYVANTQTATFSALTTAPDTTSVYVITVAPIVVGSSATAFVIPTASALYYEMLMDFSAGTGNVDREFIVEITGGYFFGVNVAGVAVGTAGAVNTIYSVRPAPIRRAGRGLVIGDSFTESSYAKGNLQTLAGYFGDFTGLDAINAGVGSTGYLEPGTINLATGGAAIYRKMNTMDRMLPPPANPAYPNGTSWRVRFNEANTGASANFDLSYGGQSTAVTFTATTNGTTSVTGISSTSIGSNTAGLWPGMVVTGTNITAGTTIATVSTNSITLSQVASGSGTQTLTQSLPFTTTGGNIGLMQLALSQMSSVGRTVLGTFTGTISNNGTTITSISPATAGSGNLVVGATIEWFNIGTGVQVLPIGSQVASVVSSSSITVNGAAGNASAQTTTTFYIVTYQVDVFGPCYTSSPIVMFRNPSTASGTLTANSANMTWTSSLSSAISVTQYVGDLVQNFQYNGAGQALPIYALFTVGHNDITTKNTNWVKSTIQTQCASLWGTIQKLYPNVTVVVVGVMWLGSLSPVTTFTVNSATVAAGSTSITVASNAGATAGIGLLGFGLDAGTTITGTGTGTITINKPTVGAIPVNTVLYHGTVADTHCALQTQAPLTLNTINGQVPFIDTYFPDFWLTGTGSRGTFTTGMAAPGVKNDGNSDILCSAIDGVHPDGLVGHYYLGRRIADAFIRLVWGQQVPYVK